ncbi:MAG TPA: T9SS type A sorting domain-containing protein [Bacteroidia bacterium]|nr:T9SS type A sorting domain-containing protein [Bacteroidia bacterium]
MKKKIVVILFLLLPLVFLSQGLINNGAHIVFSGASQMYIDGNASGNYLSQSNGSITPTASSTISLEGNWTNNSSNVAFTTDGGGVVLTGASQSIGGTNPTAFYNLTLAGNGVKTLAVNSTTVGGQATYTGILSVGSSTLDLNSNRIDITNSAAGAITRSSGYIISETNAALNPSIIRWYHRTASGSKVYPFGVAGSYIPFTFNITSAMTNASAYIDVSTRATATAFNTPWAAASNLGGPVTQMFSPNGNFPDGSDEVVIDRWWDITNSHPVTGDITFSYRGIENTLAAPYNIGFIGPQYWNGSGWISDNQIIGVGAAAVSGAAVGSVTGLNVSTFCPWVLSAKLSPLPIELLNFEAKCVNNSIVLEWCTSTEKNNSYFTIEQSIDGINYTAIGNVFAVGNSNEKQCYHYTVQSLSELNYFRLSQTDQTGIKTISKVITSSACDNLGEGITIANDGTKEVGVVFNSLVDQNLELHVHNTLGQIIEVHTLNAVKGFNNIRTNLEHVSNGIYYVSILNGSEKLISKKIIVSDFIR